MWLLLAACRAPEPPAGEVFVPSDPDAPHVESVPPATRPSPDLLLNEVQTDNLSTWTASDQSTPDWVELWNRGDEDLDLTRVRLDATTGEVWTWTGSVPAQGRAHLVAPALDADGVELTLTLDGVAVDHLATGAMPADTAWARFPDGGAWLPTARPTPGWSNGNQPSSSLDPSDALFDTVLDLELTLSADAVASLGSAPSVEVPAALGFGGVWFPAVGVHLKGVYGSFRTLDQKAAFSVDMDEYDPGLRLRGVEVFKLNNMVQDATYVHEALAYAFFRHVGVPAPRTGYARVTVNGVYYGLYTFLEGVDGEFLERWYQNPDGDLYEGAYGVDFYTDHAWWFECDRCADPDDRSDILAVAAVLDGPADDAGITALEALVDLDQVLTEQAAEAVLLHWDGYETANNYRVYHDPDSGRFSMIPWGTDQTFVDDWYGPYDGYGRLLQFCLANAGCASRYDTILLEVARAFEGFGFVERMDTMLASVQADIDADPRREWGEAQRRRSLEATRERFVVGADAIRAAVDAR